MTRQHIKIVIVDDEPNILMSLEFLMKKEGYKVFIARDGEEAVDIVRTEIPDVVLLDIMMPKVDGYEVCRFIKSSPEYQHAKVIFMSSKSRETDLQKGYDLGADLYIPKPFSTRDMVAKVNALTMSAV
ncbi:response regulator [Runella rosea]|jgi:DNA-binding response OmpR family regulator|uniref:Response regulator n=3 Tax=Runella TaxID=105 RepID=A0A344TIP2_9BACT|nr:MULTISPECIES: response regulator [Runella]AXE18513.1 response regulator [Runella rosea]MCP1381736.1 response regulator [Runella salmonicolor]NBB18361.1 response regulator [Runella sp. CRIBMP]RDB07301.1 response regulator [Runella aurantiaca]